MVENLPAKVENLPDMWPGYSSAKRPSVLEWKWHYPTLEWSHLVNSSTMHSRVVCKDPETIFFKYSFFLQSFKRNPVFLKPNIRMDPIQWKYLCLPPTSEWAEVWWVQWGEGSPSLHSPPAPAPPETWGSEGGISAELFFFFFFFLVLLNDFSNNGGYFFKFW